MGPVKQLISIPFTGGVDTKTDGFNVPPVKLTSLQNAIFQKTGAVSSRWGYKALPTAAYRVDGSYVGANISAAKALYGSYNNELLLFDGSQAWSYSATQLGWFPRGQGVVSIAQTNKTITANSGQQVSADFAPVATPDTNWEMYAYETTVPSASVVIKAIDAVSGVTIIPETAVTGTSPHRPKCLALGTTSGTPAVNVFYATVAGGATGEIQVAQASLATPAGVGFFATAPTQLASSCKLAQSKVLFDACVSGDGALRIYIVYRDSVAGSVKLMSFNPTTLATAGPVTVSTSTLTGHGLSVTSDSTGRAWVSWVDTGTGANPSVFVAAHNSALTQTLAKTETINEAFGSFTAVGTIVDQAGLLNVYGDVTGGSSNANAVYWNTITSGGSLGVAAGSAPVIKRGVGLASKPFMNSAGQIFVNVATDSTLQAQYMTITKVTTSTGWNTTTTSYPEVARALYGLGGGYVSRGDFMLPECPSVATNVFRYANMVRGSATTEAGVVTSQLGVNATTLNLSKANAFQSAQIAGGLYTAGAVVQSYDGAQFVEHGFLLYPEIVSVSDGGAGALSAGTYYYVATYEWVDNNGQRQISNVSPAVSITLAASHQGSIVVPTLRSTRKSKVQVHLYRTQANGVTLNRVTSLTSPTYNDPTVDSITITDNMSDASAAASAALYTQPLVTSAIPVIPNDAPPACSMIASYGERLWLAGLDDPSELQYTQQTIAGSPAQFSQLLTLTMDSDGGPITAIARMDQVLVIFKAQAIFYLQGQGPDATGSNNDFRSPVQIPSGQIGCSNPASVVLTPKGLFFDSGKGLYLLDRAFNVSYKGAPVEDFYNQIVNNGSSIASATSLPPQWVIWVDSYGKSIVYDDFYDQWMTFTNQSAVSSDAWIGDGGNHVFVGSNGVVYEQTPGVYTDAGTPITWTLGTAYYNPTTSGMQGTGIQGYFRFYHLYLLGTYYGAHTVAVNATFDYDATTLQPHTIDATKMANAVAGHPYEFRVDVLHKGQAVAFVVQVTPASPGNQGVAFSSLGLVVGGKSGGNKLPALQQV